MKKIQILVTIFFIMVLATSVMPARAELQTPVQDLDLGDYQTEMSVGRSQLLMVSVLPLEADHQQNIVYKSSNLDVATINMMGRITAVAIGETKISVTVGDVTRGFILKVIADTEANPDNVAVTDIEVANFKDTIKIDETIDLTATVVPSNATKPEVTYSSSNKSVASVSSAGQIKGLALGTTVITVEADGVRKTVDLTVKVPTDNIALNKTYVVLNKNDEFQLNATVTPANSDQALNFKSLSPNIATVSEKGLIKAASPGSSSIVVSTWDTSKVVSVIVNEGTSGKPATNLEGDDAQEVFSPDGAKQRELVAMIADLAPNGTLSLDGKAYEMLSSPVLKALYGTEKSITINYPKYTMTVNGSDVKNVENELSTKVDLSEKENELQFAINGGEKLPGKIIMQILDKPDYSYLYLYNTAKGNYQKLNTLKANNRFLADSNEKYVLTNSELSSSYVSWIIIGIIALIAAGLSVAYVAVKKKHWFW